VTTACNLGIFDIIAREGRPVEVGELATKVGCTGSPLYLERLCNYCTSHDLLQKTEMDGKGKSKV
jgi:hypothetical protein